MGLEWFADQENEIVTQSLHYGTVGSLDIPLRGGCVSLLYGV